MKNILFAALTVFSLSQCTEEEIAPQQAPAPAAETVALPAEASGSMTISWFDALHRERA